MNIYLVSLTGGAILFAMMGQACAASTLDNIATRQRYEQCLSLANLNPTEALKSAAEWSKAKGGAPAEHCLAMALTELKRYPEAAARLDALGFDVEKTDEGVYRAVIDVPQLPAGRHLWIEFDGVAMQCKTSINGQQVGEHKGMFSRFSYDLTPHLKPGKNELTVWASMEKIPPTTAQLGEAVTVNLSAAKVVSCSRRRSWA